MPIFAPHALARRGTSKCAPPSSRGAVLRKRRFIVSIISIELSVYLLFLEAKGNEAASRLFSCASWLVFEFSWLKRGWLRRGRALDPSEVSPLPHSLVFWILVPSILVLSFSGSSFPRPN